MKNLNTFWQIVFREVLIFLKLMKSKIIDILIITCTNVIVFTVLMPYFGLESSYGQLIAVGLISILSLFEVVPRTTNLISDITGNKKISYFLTLPLPTSLVLIAIPIGWAACGGLYTIFILPVAKIFLYHELDLSHFSLLKFVVSFITIQLMYGFFAFFLTSLIKDMKYISWVWARVINPLLMFGGYFYTWMAINSISHIAGILNLFNPVMLACETLRAAVLGQKGYIDFWFAILGLWLFIILFALFGVIRLKKRLDCV
jgi:hypothetical protein